MKICETNISLKTKLVQVFIHMGRHNLIRLLLQKSVK